MSISARGRSITAFFSVPDSIHSHRVRFVLAEKGINVDIIDVETQNPPEDLLELNPYDLGPTLVDRDLVLYETRVITEYLDERYPHPPLMPVDPVSRARLRLSQYRIGRDWYSFVDDLESGTPEAADKARSMLRDSLISSNELFTIADFFLHADLTLVDCMIAPLFWRLESWQIELPREAGAVCEYAERLFALESFQASLTELEQEMR